MVFLNPGMLIFQTSIYLQMNLNRIQIHIFGIFILALVLALPLSTIQW